MSDNINNVDSNNNDSINKMNEIHYTDSNTNNSTFYNKIIKSLNLPNLIRSSIYYSPIILSFTIIIITLLYQTYTGVIFFLFIIAFTALREFFISFRQQNNSSDNITNTNINCAKWQNKKWMCDKDWCESSNVSNGFVIFYTTFLVFYFLSPMMIYGTYNWALFCGLLIYLLFIYVFNLNIDHCIDGTTFAANVFVSLLCVVISITILISTNSNKLLFLAQLDTDSNVCSMPSSQTFKCNVYKNGEIIAST